MRFIGPDRRAQQLRSAANRLRWEVDVALGEAAGQTEPGPHPGHEAFTTLGDIAETLALLRQVVTTIDRHLPARSPLGADYRRRFANLLEYYSDYHKVAR